jgi:hypothetical protein
VSELIEVANRFADGEDAYNNKRGRSPEVDRASRQRRRYRNGDSHARRNQIVAGYDRRGDEDYENREFQARDNHGVENQSTPARRRRTCSMDLVASIMRT